MRVSNSKAEVAEDQPDPWLDGDGVRKRPPLQCRVLQVLPRSGAWSMAARACCHDPEDDETTEAAAEEDDPYRPRVLVAPQNLTVAVSHKHFRGTFTVPELTLSPARQFNPYHPAAFVPERRLAYALLPSWYPDMELAQQTVQDTPPWLDPLVLPFDGEVRHGNAHELPHRVVNGDRTPREEALLELPRPLDKSRGFVLVHPLTGQMGVHSAWYPECYVQCMLPLQWVQKRITIRSGKPTTHVFRKIFE